MFACLLIWVYWIPVTREGTECGLYEGFKFSVPKLQFFIDTCSSIWYMTGPFSCGRKAMEWTFLCSSQWNCHLTPLFLVWMCTLKITSEDRLDTGLEDCYHSQMIPQMLFYCHLYQTHPFCLPIIIAESITLFNFHYIRNLLCTFSSFMWYFKIIFH